MNIAQMTTDEIERLSLECSRELRNRTFAENGFGGVPVATDEMLRAWGAPSGRPPSPRMAAVLGK